MTDHPFNEDFTVEPGVSAAKNGRDHVERVYYKGVSIAMFRLWFEPSQEAIAEGKVRIDYPQDSDPVNTPLGYIETYGHLAEFSKQRMEALGTAVVVDWNDSMKVDIHSNIQVKLDDCPFCGHKPDHSNLADSLHPTGIYWEDLEGLEGIRGYVVHADRKGHEAAVWEFSCLETEGGCGASITGDSKKEAIDAWNKRPVKTKLTDVEIEKLAVKHEAFGFGEINDKGYTTHGFDPEGLHSFVEELLGGGEKDQLQVA